MSVIIRYQVEFPEVKLRVSNDLTLGDFILDATITAEMIRGASGSRFEIRLFNLPKSRAEALFNAVKATAGKQPAAAAGPGKPVTHVLINLGYFGSPFGLVMEGIVDQARAVVEEDKLVTILKGMETGTHALQNTPFQSTFDQEVTVEKAIKDLLRDLKVTSGAISRDPQIQGVKGSLRNKVIRGKNVLEALDQVASSVGAELLVVDKKVWVGNPIRDSSYTPGEFSLRSNLGTFEPFAEKVPDEKDRTVVPRVQAAGAEGFTFVVAGDPKLRPGQRVTAALDGFGKAEGGEFRIHSLSHTFSVTDGYTCKGRAIKANDSNAQKGQRVAEQPSASSLIDGISKLVTAQRKQSPTIEVGKVQTFTPGSEAKQPCRATLYYGQTYERTEVQPSIHTAVESKADQRFPDKPVVSPFAWHKCGLVTPVYPGMKAVLCHNQNLEDDALVSGFLWSEEPAITPPQSKQGDWWLCLPIDFKTEEPPKDSTKAANDLTANNGRRVIEVKGLKITVGADKLGNVGARPAEGAEDEFLIEHKKARIHIAASGEIKMQADTGGVTLTIGSSGVQIS